MSDAAATGFLAVVAAISVGFGAVWPFWLSKILAVTSERPDPTLTPRALEVKYRKLDVVVIPARIYTIGTGAVMVAMLIAGGIVARDAMVGELWTWPRVTVLASVLVWLVFGGWLLGRCRRVETYRTMIDQWANDAGSRQPPREAS